jgi:hypothetical protein
MRWAVAPKELIKSDADMGIRSNYNMLAAGKTMVYGMPTGTKLLTGTDKQMKGFDMLHAFVDLLSGSFGAQVHGLTIPDRDERHCIVSQRRTKHILDISSNFAVHNQLIVFSQEGNVFTMRQYHPNLENVDMHRCTQINSWRPHGVFVEVVRSNKPSLKEIERYTIKNCLHLEEGQLKSFNQYFYMEESFGKNVGSVIKRLTSFQDYSVITKAAIMNQNEMVAEERKQVGREEGDETFGFGGRDEPSSGDWMGSMSTTVPERKDGYTDNYAKIAMQMGQVPAQGLIGPGFDGGRMDASMMASVFSGAPSQENVLSMMGY